MEEVESGEESWGSAHFRQQCLSLEQRQQLLPNDHTSYKLRDSHADHVDDLPIRRIKHRSNAVREVFTRRDDQPILCDRKMSHEDIS
ncbi:UNVERIFIED_CONTAM: hypothetical protein NY603_22130, partial [Bacteroidetes bacterium 56_B9]